MQEVLRFALLGFGIGALYTLASQGLIVIYRGSGVLNFGLGAVGIAAAYIQWELQTKHGQSFAVSFVIGVAVAALLGALTHLLVMRRLRQASPLARLVATLGVLTLLQAAVVLKWGSDIQYVQSELPTTLVHLGNGLVVSVDRFILLGIAAVLSVVLYLVYRYTKFGLATTAVAENERAAAAVGLSPDRIATVNWALGSALAGVAAILIAPISTLQVGSMTNLVLAALAAALVANFRSFPIAFFASMAIGIVQTEIARYWTQAGAAQSVPFVVIVAALVLTGRALPLRDYFLQRLPSVGSGRVRPELVVPGVLVCVLLISVTPADWVGAFVTTFGAALIILSVVVVTGYAGQVSLAQYAIAGIGAYISGRLVAAQDWPFWAAFAAGLIGTVPIGVLFALPAVRTRGINLAIVTLGLGTAVELVLFANADYTGGLAGTVVGSPHLFGFDIGFPSHPARYGLFALGCFVVVALMVANVRRGRTGRRLLAVRTNERAAAALGVSVPSAKLYSFALAAGIAAVGGMVIAFGNDSILYTSFTNFQSITYVGWAFLGGIGYLMGPVMGALLVPGALGTQLTNHWFGNAGDWLQLVGGIMLINIVLQNQNGMVKEIIKQYAWIGRKLRPLVSWIPTPSWFWRDSTIELPLGRREPVAPHTLEVRDLTVRYGTVTAVDALSLDVRPGQIVGLIGPNGAGKTTAIDGITGFARPASGTLRLNGEDITSWSVVKRSRSGISRSFQSLELFEDATVLDNLRVASDPRDGFSYLRDLVWPKDPPLLPEVVAAIREFRLEDDLLRNVEDLSYGRRREVAIARAVATRPAVLLLDEPAAGLSDSESAEFAQLVRRLADQLGMAILLVEHDMNFVMTISDHIVVLDFGRKISEGTPDYVRNDAAVITAYLGEDEDELLDEQLTEQEAPSA
jgi:ABC-type branched-subunit amino acid transport system ATPase component/ABC-type branched-subunit amino acid transport system permease subunit